MAAKEGQRVTMQNSLLYATQAFNSDIYQTKNAPCDGHEFNYKVSNF